MPPFAPPPASHTLTSLRGLRAAGIAAGIKPSGNPDLALLVADEPLACAGVFTRNKLAAAPVLLDREHLARSGGLVRAVVVNSGNANACTGEEGASHALQMARRVAGALGCPQEQVLVASTGVIGVKLPIDRVLAGIDRALDALSSAPEAGRDFLRAIQTTDAFPKEASAELPDARGEQALVAGVCKGAGMIHPDMATMLAFVATDLRLGPADLAAWIPRIAARSFNAVHVDTHASTNDTFLLLSTGLRPSPGDDASAEALARVARRLAWLIARDGEGATKVTTIEVQGARDDAAARSIAARVASSALVRTALFGNDPNWGRFTSQVGNCPEVGDITALRCVLQGVPVFARGEPLPHDRAAVSAAMAAEDVHLLLALADGEGSASLLTSDLGYRYVEVNAEYTT
jgi:glutamate N-acetyltransferase/amino-acid N-acetyltransferase